MINRVLTCVQLKPVKFFLTDIASLKHVFWFRFKLFVYDFVLFVQKEISATRIRKIIFDHLIILILFHQRCTRAALVQWLNRSVGDRELVSSSMIFSNLI